jgi:hypothetical protein
MDPEQPIPAARSRWEKLVWPHWLPIRARLPLIAQITGALALFAAVMMPQSSEIAPVPPLNGAPVTSAAPGPVEAPAALATPVVPEPPATPVETARPAHLNLDLRHSFRSVELTVTVDDKRVLNTVLEGSGKRFGVFGRRTQRSYARTLDLQPGARVVRLRLKSAEEKFEHTRVERFDLYPATVATMRIDIEKGGLSVIADRPAPPPPAAVAAALAGQPAAPQPLDPSRVEQAAQAAQAAHEASAVAALYQSLRSVLITLAGLIGSTATAFVVQEFLKQRKVVDFKGGQQTQAARILRRRRERRDASRESDISIDAGLS